MNLIGVLILAVLLLGGVAVAGDSRQQVRQIMGAPTEATDAMIGIYGSKRRVANRVKGCTKQYWYYPFFTPECWWIAFDAQGQVLTTFHYISP